MCVILDKLSPIPQLQHCTLPLSPYPYLANSSWDWIPDAVLSDVPALSALFEQVSIGFVVKLAADELQVILKAAISSATLFVSALSIAFLLDLTKVNMCNADLLMHSLRIQQACFHYYIVKPLLINSFITKVFPSLTPSYSNTVTKMKTCFSEMKSEFQHAWVWQTFGKG